MARHPEEPGGINVPPESDMPTPKPTAEEQLKSVTFCYGNRCPLVYLSDATNALKSATRQAFEEAAIEGEQRGCACHYRLGRHRPSCVLSLAEWCRVRALAKGEGK